MTCILFYKCVQLVQGEILLISIVETSKLVSPQFLLFTLFCFREKNGEKTLQLTSINFVYMRLPDLWRIARVYLGVRTCELFLCFAPFVFLRSIVLTSLFPLFYVTCEFNRFLHRGWAHCANRHGVLHPKSKVWSSTTPLYQNISI